MQDLAGCDAKIATSEQNEYFSVIQFDFVRASGYKAY